MRPALLLPVRFDPARLTSELQGLPAQAWIRHYNTRDYEGEWRGAPLRAPRGHAAPLAAIGGPGVVYDDTAWLAAMPSFQEVIRFFACPLRSVRLLELAPGAKILEHRDPDLGFAYGEARLHVPVVTHPKVSFFVAGQRVPMVAGECWYIDVSEPHHVHNASDVPRVHLVLDAIVDDWLTDLLRRGTPPPPETTPSVSQVDALVEALSASPERIARLEPLTDRALFLAEVLTLAQELGLDVGPGELEARMRENQRAWIERGLG